MKAVLRRIRITPKKANLVAGMVRGKTVKEALNLLKFMPKKGAKLIYKVVKSAAANAKNNYNQSVDDLIVTNIWATKGPSFKRSLPASRGRSWPIVKHTSHITVEVGLPEGVEPKKAVKSKEKTEEKPAKVVTKVKTTETTAAKKAPVAKAASKKEVKSAKK